MISQESVSILLVGAKTDLPGFLRAKLDSSEFTVVECPSCNKALGTAASADYAVILISSKIRFADSLAFAKKSRELLTAKDTPMMLVARKLERHQAHEAHLSGIADVVDEPYDELAVLLKLEAYVRLYKKTLQASLRGEIVKEKERAERERERSELELKSLRRERHVQQKYRDLVESIEHGILWIADPLSLNILFVSPRAEKLTGHPLRDWVTRRGFFFSKVPKEDRTRVIEAFDRADWGASLNIEHRFLDKNGKMLWFQTAVKLVENAEGSGHELRGFSVDVTAVKNSQHDLQIFKERFSTVVDASPIVVFGIDNAGTISFGRGRDLKSIGLSDDWIGKSAFELYKDDPEFVGMMQRALNGEQFTSEVCFRHSWFQCLFSPQRDFKDRISGATMVALDTTSKKLADGRQRFLFESWEVLSDSLDYEATLKKVASLIVPRFADWCAVQLFESVKRAKIVAAAHADTAKTSIIQELAPFFPLRRRLPGEVQDPSRVSVYRDLKPSDISMKPVEEKYLNFVELLGLKSLVSVPLLARGRSIGFISFVSSSKNYSDEDAAFFEELARRAALAVDNARLYRNAEKAVNTRDEFLSIASHELKTPLTPLRLQLQSIQKAFNEGKLEYLKSRMGSMLERSDRQISRLTGLIDDLLDVSRINLGRMQLDLKDTDLSHLLEEVADQFGDQIEESGCTLRLNVEKGIRGKWDSFRIEQVIVNLLTNAMKYAPKSTIQITATSGPDSAQVRVADSGIGIAKEDQVRIFKLFERAASPKHYGGLGLGLYIVKNIVEAHGGSVGVSSREGFGTAFTVDLPFYYQPEINFPGNKKRRATDLMALP